LPRPGFFCVNLELDWTYFIRIYNSAYLNIQFLTFIFGKSFTCYHTVPSAALQFVLQLKQKTWDCILATVSALQSNSLSNTPLSAVWVVFFVFIHWNVERIVLWALSSVLFFGENMNLVMTGRPNFPLKVPSHQIMAGWVGLDEYYIDRGWYTWMSSLFFKFKCKFSCILLKWSVLHEVIIFETFVCLYCSSKCAKPPRKTFIKLQKVMFALLTQSQG